MTRTTSNLAVGDGLLGRVVNAHGKPIDSLPRPWLPHRSPLDREPPDPLSRKRVTEALSLGVRSMDGLLTCGRGQRLGIFAGSGVGKSSTLGMIAQYSTADVNVIGLIGERGREVNDFLEKELGPEGLARSVVVVATGDESALMRTKAAKTTTAIAESFRDRGMNVLLMMDSLTRFALAQREIGLAAGEPPASRGYPPSVLSSLPRLVERTGNSDRGSITAIYTVLVEGDDLQEPISDTVRGLLDGHVVLTRKLANANHYPAVDVLQSVSRVMPELVDETHRAAAATLRRMLSALQEAEDLIAVGAYQRGTQPLLDAAIALRPEWTQYLRQDLHERSDFASARQRLIELAGKIAAATGRKV
jgi:FliI/YscN family ATPase